MAKYLDPKTGRPFEKVWGEYQDLLVELILQFVSRKKTENADMERARIAAKAMCAL